MCCAEVEGVSGWVPVAASVCVPLSGTSLAPVCVGQCAAAELYPGSPERACFAPVHINIPDSLRAAPWSPLHKCCSLITESKASKGLEQIAELMAQGKLKVHFDK